MKNTLRYFSDLYLISYYDYVAERGTANICRASFVVISSLFYPNIPLHFAPFCCCPERNKPCP